MPDIPLQLLEVGVSTASALNPRIHVAGLSARTDIAGKYLFTNVPVGSYKVTASLSIDTGLVFGSSTGTSAALIVQAGKETYVEVPAVGESTLKGLTIDASNNKPIANAQVFCTWAAFDLTLTTKDDVEIPVTSDGKGQFTMSGIPAGDYSCRWKNGATGEVFDAASVNVKPVTSGKSTPAVVRLKATAKQVSRMVIPSTGSSSREQTKLAVEILLLGVVLLTTSLRRRCQHR